MVGITYSGKKEEDLTIKNYSASDWAGEHTIEMLISGFVFILNRGSVN